MFRPIFSAISVMFKHRQPVRGETIAKALGEQAALTAGLHAFKRHAAYRPYRGFSHQSWLRRKTRMHMQKESRRVNRSH